MKTRGSRSIFDIPYTRRDIEIVYAVFVSRYMTTPQIWKLFFSHTSMLVCNQRLKKLVDYGLLRVIEQAEKRGEGRKPYIYALTPLGGELLTHERGIDPKLINVKPYADESNSLKLKHILATTDFLIAIQQACRAGEYTLEAWETEREYRSRLTKETIQFIGFDGNTYKTPIPDLFITLKREDKRAFCQVEVDRATEDIGLSSFERQSIVGKAIEYLAWEESALYQQDPELTVRPLRVLFVNTGAKRRDNMKQAVENMIRKQLMAQSHLTHEQMQEKYIWLGKRFRFITFDAIRPESILTDPVWHVAGDDALSTLVS